MARRVIKSINSKCGIKGMKPKIKMILYFAVITTLLAGGGLVVFRETLPSAYERLKLIYRSKSLWNPTMDDYKEVVCPKDAIAIGYFGQSNSANYVFPRYSHSIPSNLLQFNWSTGRCYEYKEPLLGTDGLGGNTITYFASKLSHQTGKPILIVPFGKGTSSAFDWSNGALAGHHEAVMKMMAEKKLNVVAFFWHQGESGSGAPENFQFANSLNFTPEQKSREAYRLFLNKIITKTRAKYPNAHFGIALASMCGGITSKETTEAQRSVAFSNVRNFVSADSDRIVGPINRYDNCHFTIEGSKTLGERYYDSFTKKIKP